ncbi:HEAT repeat domain-containing protein [Mycoavidus sp. HKI]|uniref:HEAT repeat domain-containing protein n=1 Tax=Mycoavidus sp. HKI TaxID=2840467 RepID=UPI001CBFFED9|nr:HEAT repeat domain-containing protein [Mycoavidus sp. HKI]UAW63432.1 HEAT repeat domain-containing protein [Mycoavidus sp. HKI]
MNKVGSLLKTIKFTLLPRHCDARVQTDPIPEKTTQSARQAHFRKDSGIELPPSPAATFPPATQETYQLAYAISQDSEAIPHDSEPTKKKHSWINHAKQVAKQFQQTKLKKWAPTQQAMSQSLDGLKQIWLAPRTNTKQSVSMPLAWPTLWTTPPSDPLGNSSQSKTQRRAKQAAALYQLTPRNEQMTTRALSLTALRRALYQQYECSGLSIQRLSGQKVQLDTCHTHLTLVERHLQPQPNQTEQKPLAALECLANDESRATSHDNRPISLATLFEQQTLRNGSIGLPKRVLIHGQAGIGKTTLCKKLVYDYQHNALWQDRFDCVLWLPLAQFKTDQTIKFEELLGEHFFANQESLQTQALTQTFERHRDKTLFILDGLDEVIGELDEGRPLNKLLQKLLDQTHVLITSRSVGVNPQILSQFDLQLEATGLNLDDVQTYVQKFVPAASQAAIQQLIQSTPLTQGLLKLPILLDALCASRENSRPDQTITMVTLYEAIVDQLWRKDCARLKKRDQSERLQPSVIQTLPKAKLEELMATELYALGYLAFTGLEAGKTELNLNQLTHNKTLLGIKSPSRLVTDLKQTSFLHTVDIEPPEFERDYHFLHLSLQEFFAAKFLAQHLQVDAKTNPAPTFTNSAPIHSNLILSQAQLRTFIAEHKYDPRYEVVWQMLAGLLKGAALERFFTLLEEEPRDVLGIRHQHVIIGCLHEARAHLKETTVDRLEMELMQWLRFELSLSTESVSELGCHRGFSEHLLLTYLNQPDSKKASLIRTLNARSALSNNATQAILSVLLKHNENKEAKVAAAEVLGQQHTLSSAVVQALSTALQNKDEDEDVRIAAIRACGRQETLTEAVILALIVALLDETWDIRYAAGKILSRQKTLPDTAIQLLITALQNKEKHIRSTAAEALGQQQPLSETITQALIAVLQNTGEDKEVRAMAASAFGQQQTLPEAAMHALLMVLHNKNENEDLRASAAEVFSWREPLEPSISQILISRLLDTDEKEYIRSTAAQVLNRRQIIPETAIQALSAVLQDKSEKENIRISVAKALNNQDTLPPRLIQALLSMLKGEIENESWRIRMTAADILGQEALLSAEIIQDLTEILQNQDQEWRLRWAATQALHRQPRLPADTCQALIIALADENKKIRSAAAMVLSRQEILSNEVLQAWIKTLSSTDQDIQSKAAKTLGQNQTLPDHAKLALTEALLDQESTVRIEAIKALSTQKELPEAVIQAWDSILKNKTEDASIRSTVAQALGQQETLPNTVMQTLVTVLEDQDEEESVISAAAKALNQHKALSDTVMQAWDSMLKNKEKKKSFRMTAAEALGQQEALPATVLQTLVAVLKDQDEDKYLIYAVAKALNQQKILPDTMLRALVTMLQNKNNHQSVLTKILNLHIDQLYTLLPSLAPEQIQALYTKVLFPWSSTHLAPLYIHNNRLYFYTTTGLKNSVSLTAKQTAVFMNAVSENNVPLRRRPRLNIQTNLSTYRSDPTEPSLLRKLASPPAIQNSELAHLCTDIQGQAHLV